MKGLECQMSRLLIEGISGSVFNPGRTIADWKNKIKSYRLKKGENMDILLNPSTKIFDKNGINEYLTINEVCYILKINTTVCAELTREGILRSHNISGIDFYKLDEVKKMQ